MANGKPKFDAHFKELLLERDFGYFLKRDLDLGNYGAENTSRIYASFEAHKKELKKQIKQNKKQCLNYLHGQVVLMFDGGLLSSLFRLDGSTREFGITDFEGIGMNWAYFDLWRKHERRKLFRKNAWDHVTKIGAVLAIFLSVLKLVEAFSPAAK